MNLNPQDMACLFGKVFGSERLSVLERLPVLIQGAGYDTSDDLMLAMLTNGKIATGQKLLRELVPARMHVPTRMLVRAHEFIVRSC